MMRRSMLMLAIATNNFHNGRSYREKKNFKINRDRLIDSFIDLLITQSSISGGNRPIIQLFQ